jgi:hypothetical protein
MLMHWSLTIMSSMYHEVRSFADVPAVICVNGVSLDSTMSLSFLHNFNVPHSICNHDGVAVELSSGPVHVPTVNGWYNSWQIFCSVYLKGCDVELGCDWFMFMNVRFDGSRFLGLWRQILHGFVPVILGTLKLEVRVLVHIIFSYS